MSAEHGSKRTERSGIIASFRVLIRLAWTRTLSPPVMGALAILVVLPTILTLLLDPGAGAADRTEYLLRRYGSMVAGLTTPLIALVGGSAMNAEREEGTLVYLVTTTVSRRWIVVSRLVFASMLTIILSAISVLTMGGVVFGADDPDGIVGAVVVATSFGAVVYAALFTLLSLLTRRALVVGLMYLIVWEALFPTLLSATGYLSVRSWMLAIVASMIGSADLADLGGPSAGFAVGAGMMVLVVVIGMGGRLLDRSSLSRSGQ